MGLNFIQTQIFCLQKKKIVFLRHLENASISVGFSSHYRCLACRAGGSTKPPGVPKGRPRSKFHFPGGVPGLQGWVPCLCLRDRFARTLSARELENLGLACRKDEVWQKPDGDPQAPGKVSKSISHGDGPLSLTVGPLQSPQHRCGLAWAPSLHPLPPIAHTFSTTDVFVSSALQPMLSLFPRYHPSPPPAVPASLVPPSPTTHSGRPHPGTLFLHDFYILPITRP